MKEIIIVFIYSIISRNINQLLNAKYYIFDGREKEEAIRRKTEITSKLRQHLHAKRDRKPIGSSIAYQYRRPSFVIIAVPMTIVTSARKHNRRHNKTPPSTSIPPASGGERRASD